MLYAQLFFPTLPLEALGADYEGLCVAVHDRQVIRNASPQALTAGVLPGMTLGMALTLCDRLKARPAAPKKEQQLLHQWAHWAYHYSNQVAIRKGGLCLEIGKSERLLGPPKSIIRTLQEAAHAAGRPMQVALGHTPEMADVFLRQQRCPLPEDFAATLAKTPLKATGLPEKALRRLSLMGFRTLGDYMQVPTRARQKRLSQTDFEALEAVLGHRMAPLRWFSPPPTFHQHLTFLRGLETHDMLRFPLHRLSQDASRWLFHRQCASDHLAWTLTLENKKVLQLPIHLNQPEWHPEALFEPSGLALQRITLESPVTEVSLRIQHPSARYPSTSDFLQTGETEDRARLLNRLKARLGESAIQTPCRLPDPRPEKANHWSSDPSLVEPPALPPRPVWWLKSPMLLGEAPESAGHQLLQGPERLESGWWDLEPACRQYWISRHTDRLAWIYQDQYSKHWWLAGWFA